MTRITYSDKLEQKFVKNMVIRQVVNLHRFPLATSLTYTISAPQHEVSLFLPFRRTKILFVLYLASLPFTFVLDLLLASTFVDLCLLPLAFSFSECVASLAPLGSYCFVEPLPVV